MAAFTPPIIGDYLHLNATTASTDVVIEVGESASTYDYLFEKPKKRDKKYDKNRFKKFYKVKKR